jgi:hypothetical protein
MNSPQRVPLVERDAHWKTRRTRLIEELTPQLRAQHPGDTWPQLSTRVLAEVDLRLLYERFGNEP